MLFGCQCHNILGYTEQLKQITKCAAAVRRGYSSNSDISQLMFFFIFYAYSVCFLMMISHDKLCVLYFPRCTACGCCRVTGSLKLLMWQTMENHLSI